MSNPISLVHTTSAPVQAFLSNQLGNYTPDAGHNSAIPHDTIDLTHTAVQTTSVIPVPIAGDNQAG